MMSEWEPRSAEPYRPGNLAAVKHGAFSERLLGESIDEISAHAVGLVPWLGAPEFRAALRAWARAEAVAERLFAYIETEGVFNDNGEPRQKALEAWRGSERLAAERRRDLGLDPNSRLKLESAFASTERDRALKEQLQQGRRLRLAAENKSSDTPVDDADGLRNPSETSETVVTSDSPSPRRTSSPEGKGRSSRPRGSSVGMQTKDQRP